MAKMGLPQVVTRLYELLEPLDSESRQRAFGSVQAMLGEVGLGKASDLSGTATAGDQQSSFNPSKSPKVSKWIREHSLTDDALSEVFHSENDRVELISHDFAATTKSERTQACYLLAGAEAFLTTGEAKFGDDRAMTLAKNAGCFDTNNNATYRKQLGNQLAGSKAAGFMLTSPGLRAAAQIIQGMVARP